MIATTPTIEATPAKLRDGSWGIRFTTDVRQGKDVLEAWARDWTSDPVLVQVRTKAGKTWVARLSGIVSCRKDARKDPPCNVVLATTQPHKEQAPPKQSQAFRADLDRSAHCASCQALTLTWKVDGEWYCLECLPQQHRDAVVSRRERLEKQADRRPVFRAYGVCGNGCGQDGTLYGRYAPGMCGECWDERYS